jgi:hypothetical protein
MKAPNAHAWKKPARSRHALLGMVIAMASLAPAHAQQEAQSEPDWTAEAPAAPAQMPTGSVGGMGDVNLFPKRVVLNERQRIASIGLYNRGTAASDYEISVADRMMTPEGRLIDLAAVADQAERNRVKAASSLLRWSPRRVALMGSDAQTVRVMARITPDLPAGEYRSHFIATAVPPGGDGSFSIEDAAGVGQSGDIGVRIVPRFGISIPIILRVGETTLEAGIENPRVITIGTGEKAIAFTITREGTRSAFGDITVTAPGLRMPVAISRGIGVYTEINRREVVIPVAAEALAVLAKPGTRLTLTYTDDDFAPGQVLARQEFAVP